MDHSGRFELNDVEAVKEWGLDVVIDFCEKAKAALEAKENEPTTKYIKEANAVYTGGNIWLFYGELNDGNYFLTDDNGWTQFLNADPSNLDESTFEEWQLQHLVKEIVGDERVKFCDELLDYIYENPEHDGGMSEQEIETYRTWFKSDNY